MAKRSGCADNQLTKKAKVDDLNDLWDDDLDGDVIDDCFKKATQRISNEEHLTPSYSIFKQPNGIICSTQISQQENQEAKLKQLQEKYTEKEGEVTILRANLQNLRTTCQSEQERREKEWKYKLNSIQKESRSVKSELEFKNLEIANLKQQISELSKHIIINDQNGTQKSKVTECRISSPQKIENQVNTCTDKIQINSKIYYPLKQYPFSSKIFKVSSEENFIIKTKYNSYRLKNHAQTVNLRKTPVWINEKELDLDFVYPEIALLLNLSWEDLNSEKSEPALNKIICVTQQLLTDFHDYLTQIEENIQLQDVQESDSQYLQEIEHFQDSVGIKCGKLLLFLAEITPFSSYFQRFLLQDQLLHLNVDYVNLLPCLKNKTKLENSYFILISKIILTMGRTRREQFCSEFLIAVVTLLCRIFTFRKKSIQMSSLIYDIVKEVLFLRPQHKVIYRITFLLKSASSDWKFVDCLCSRPNETNTIKNTTKGILYFNRESCRFHMFVILLENTLLKIYNKKETFSISLNVLSFIYNIFKINNLLWLYQSEDNRCNCLCQLYKLGIGIIYKNLKSYQESPFDHVEDKTSYQTIFKNAVKILHLLTSHSYDFIQKYVTDLARFKEIVYSLLQLCGEFELDTEKLENLDKLTVVEDFPEISSVKFAEIDF